MALNKWWTPVRVVHRGAWWVFVVVTLVVGSVRWVGFGSFTEVTYHGSYKPLNGVEMSKAYATSLDISYDVAGGRPNWLTALSLIAFVAVMLTAMFEAVVVRHRVRSAVTVAGPLVALLVIALSLNGTGHDVVKPLLTVAGVLIAVAVHEGCMAAGRVAFPGR